MEVNVETKGNLTIANNGEQTKENNLKSDGEAIENEISIEVPQPETYLNVPGNISNVESGSTSKPMYERTGSNASKGSGGSWQGITRKLNRTTRWGRSYKKSSSPGRLGFATKRGRTFRKTLRHMKVVSAGNSSQYGRQPTGEQRLRTFVIKEILETEQQYLKLLMFMNTRIFPELQSLAESTEAVTNDNVSSLQCNISDLVSVHLKLCEKLEKATEPFPFHTQKVGKYFTEMKDDFRVYDKYCSNFKQAQSIAYDVEKVPEVDTLVEEWKKSVESSNRKFSRLEDFIIAPVQRICKYPLLLRELLKYTPSQHADHKTVKEAHQVMENVTYSVNESERKSLLLQAISDVESTCDAWENSGFLGKQGFLTKRASGGSYKTWHIRWCVLSQYKLQFYEEPACEEPLSEIDLTAYRQIHPDCATETKRPFSFGIKLPERCFYMYATTEDERSEWLSIFRWKIECIDRSRRQARNPFETAVFTSVSSFLNPRSLRTSQSNEDLEHSTEENPQIKTVNSKFKAMNISKSKNTRKNKSKKSKKKTDSKKTTDD